MISPILIDRPISPAVFVIVILVAA